jgi:hypothetical protein
MKLTLESLIEAIQEAGTLAELKQLVGPSEAQKRLAMMRVARIDEMQAQWAHRDHMPPYTQLVYDMMVDHQQAYESFYH